MRGSERVVMEEITYKDVKYKITCISCYEMAMSAKDNKFRDDVIIYNLEQMKVCKNIHHTKV